MMMKMKTPKSICLWLTVFCVQAWAVARSRDRLYMNPVTEALEYVQEIANQGEGNCSFGPTLNLEYEKERWTQEATVAIRGANLLTSFSRTGGHIFGMGDQDEQLLYAIVMANVDNNPNVFGSAIAYDYLLYRDYEIFSPYAFRASDGTEVKDLSIGYDYLTNSTDWFHIPYVNFQNDSIISSNYTYHRNPSSNATFMARLDLGHGYWTKPYFDCGGGNVWMVTFSMPFFLPAREESANLSADLQTETLKFAGVTTIDIALSSLDINQCPKNESGLDNQNVFDPFVDTHLCKNTTYCKPMSGRGFERGAYICVCLQGYYFPDTANTYQAFNGSEIESEYIKKVRGYQNIYDSYFTCLRCMEGCDECIDDSPCFLEPSVALRITAMTLTIMCIVVLVILAIYTFVNRENKVFKAASPGLLYVFLFGSAIMYAEIVLHAVLAGPLASWHCIFEPWARYIGIALAYGALLFKTWRITVVFTVRSAKPIRITDARLYVRVGVLVILTALFLGVVTLLLLAWGVYLCVKVRKAPSSFNESKFISICIYNETLMSVFSIIMTTVVLESVEQTESAADKQFIVGVCRVHLTVTTMVVFLYGSKIYHVMQTRLQQTTGTSLELKTKDSAARGPTGLSTLDSISPTIDFCYTNPDVKSEMQRMTKVLDLIQEDLTLLDSDMQQTSFTNIQQDLTIEVPQRPISNLDGGEDDVPGPSHAGTACSAQQKAPRTLKTSGSV